MNFVFQYLKVWEGRAGKKYLQNPMNENKVEQAAAKNFWQSLDDYIFDTVNFRNYQMAFGGENTIPNH